MNNQELQDIKELLRKFNAALAAINGNKSVEVLCEEFGVSQSQLYEWKKILQENGPKLFADKRRSKNKIPDETKKLKKDLDHANEKIDFLERAFNRCQ